MPKKKIMPSRHVQVLALIALISTLIFTERRKWPDVPLNQIQGRYHNPCCADILVTQQYIEFNGSRVHYHVDRLKYGTELTPDNPVKPFYWTNANGEQEVNTFVLTKNRDGISLTTKSFTGKNYSFQKILR
jgi:hypothetical protein